MKAFIIDDVSLTVNDPLPFFLILINQILHLKSHARRQVLDTAERKDAGECGLKESQVDLRGSEGLLFLVGGVLLLLLAFSDCSADDERGDLEHHLHEDLYREVVHVVIVQHGIYAGFDNGLLDLPLDEELHQ